MGSFFVKCSCRLQRERSSPPPPFGGGWNGQGQFFWTPRARFLTFDFFDTVAFRFLFREGRSPLADGRIGACFSDFFGFHSNARRRGPLVFPVKE